MPATPSTGNPAARPRSQGGGVPLVVPDDLDDPALVKASGSVTLPLHLSWSSPPREFDLGDDADAARLYEIVLREGSADDLRYWIELDRLVSLWDRLYLPADRRETLANWIAARRAPNRSC